jgi:hypothetical protein
MQHNHFLAKPRTALAACAFALALAGSATFAASEFEGTWKTVDATGKPFTITLSEDGKASGQRTGEGLKGTWKADGDSAVITWDSGWTTTLTKEGDKYKKTASEGGKPSGSAVDAEKVK